MLWAVGNSYPGHRPVPWSVGQPPAQLPEWGSGPLPQSGAPSLSPAPAGKWELSDVPGLLFSSFWEQVNQI